MSDTVTFTCRLPTGARTAVKTLAGHNHRSMNAELLHILETEPSGSLPANALILTGRSGDQFQFRLPSDLHESLTAQAQASGRSLNSEISYRVQCHLHDRGASPDAGNHPDRSSPDALIYRAPPAASRPATTRRVYVLPIELVRRIHEYGYANGHQSEVSAVRELLEAGLLAKEGA